MVAHTGHLPCSPKKSFQAAHLQGIPREHGASLSQNFQCQGRCFSLGAADGWTEWISYSLEVLFHLILLRHVVHIPLYFHVLCE